MGSQFLSPDIPLHENGKRRGGPNVGVKVMQATSTNVYLQITPR